VCDIVCLFLNESEISWAVCVCTLEKENVVNFHSNRAFSQSDGMVI